MGGWVGVVFLSINVNFCTCVLTFAVKMDKKKQRDKEEQLCFSAANNSISILVTIVTRTVSSLYTHSVCVFYLCFCVHTCAHVCVYVYNDASIVQVRACTCVCDVAKTAAGKPRGRYRTSNSGFSY